MPISVSGTQITFNDATVQTTAATGGVTSLNGETGAITNTGFNAIGSYSGGSTSGSAYNAGATLAGTSLRQRIDEANGVFSNLDSRVTVGNIGQTGTWRAMANSRTFNFGCGIIISSTNLWVRIS
jgi:hypothetical protein